MLMFNALEIPEAVRVIESLLVDDANAAGHQASDSLLSERTTMTRMAVCVTGNLPLMIR